ncbi:hypothetical protein HYC85_028361 [Camellia sinensis]|uniref:Uncharacterized protein n=1 Tax=Camellia sinensis TaxID=4442 RepID=A0A7J7FUZ8_CAMSI|nr:hypothetical protein HYC85_028361 [Camellia sinensis]
MVCTPLPPTVISDLVLCVFGKNRVCFSKIAQKSKWSKSTFDHINLKLPTRQAQLQKSRRKRISDDSACATRATDAVLTRAHSLPEEEDA